MAHARHKFHDLYRTHRSPVTKEALEMHCALIRDREETRGRLPAAAIYSLMASAKLNGMNPEAYLTAVLRRIADHPINRI